MGRLGRVYDGEAGDEGDVVGMGGGQAAQRGKVAHAGALEEDHARSNCSHLGAGYWFSFPEDKRSNNKQID